MRIFFYNQVLKPNQFTYFATRGNEFSSKLAAIISLEKCKEWNWNSFLSRSLQVDFLHISVQFFLINSGIFSYSNQFLMFWEIISDLVYGDKNRFWTRKLTFYIVTSHLSTTIQIQWSLNIFSKSQFMILNFYIWQISS